MCPLILLLPVFALPLLWVLPLTWSLPLYGVVCALSAWMYYFVMKAMRRPVESGREELLHSVGEVVEAFAGSLHVRVHGEIWAPSAINRWRRVTAYALTGSTVSRCK